MGEGDRLLHQTASVVTSSDAFREDGDMSQGIKKYQPNSYPCNPDTTSGRIVLRGFKTSLCETDVCSVFSNGGILYIENNARDVKKV